METGALANQMLKSRYLVFTLAAWDVKAWVWSAWANAANKSVLDTMPIGLLESSTTITRWICTLIMLRASSPMVAVAATVTGSRVHVVPDVLVRQCLRIDQLPRGTKRR